MSLTSHPRRRFRPTLGRALSSIAVVVASGCAAPDLAVSPLGGSTEPLLARPSTSIPVAFTVSDAPGYRITSDGLGEYVHGQQTVSAEIDSYGNLQVSVTSALPPARMLTFDYSAPLDPANSYRPSLAGTRWFRIKSNKTNNGNPGIDQLTVGGTGCYNVTVAHGDGVVQYVDNYVTASDPLSTYVRITRTSSSTWTMETAGGCSGTPDQAALYSQDMSRKNQPRLFRGYFGLSFFMVLRTI